MTRTERLACSHETGAERAPTKVSNAQIANFAKLLTGAVVLDVFGPSVAFAAPSACCVSPSPQQY